MIKKLVVGSIDTNCYLVWDEDNNAILIDPADNANIIFSKINEFNLNLNNIFITHGHWDHIGAVKELIQAYPVTILIHNDDKDSLISEDLNIQLVEDGEEYTVGNRTYKIIHTPGHTPGSICISNGNNLFTGDTLFNGSVGRTDFPGGSTKDLMRSLDKLLELPENTVIYPGHGAITSMDVEIKINPYLIHRTKGS